MTKPKYLSRFTYNSAVDVENTDGKRYPGTVRAVKFSESAVHYDVVVNGIPHQNVPSMRVHSPSQDKPDYTETKEVA